MSEPEAPAAEVRASPGGPANRRRVAAVTLNWHDTPSTLACLASLQEARALDPIIVVDNESDGSLQQSVALQGMRASVVSMAENRGFAGGINPGLGAALAAGVEFVLVINNDATIDPDSVEALIARAESDPALGAVGPMIVYPDGSPQTLGVRWSSAGTRLEQLLEPGPFDSLTWACILLRARCLEDAGFLDERFFMYWEDFEFSRRITDRGWRLSLEPRAVAVHALSSSASRAGSKLATYHIWGLIVLARIRSGVDRRHSLVRLATLFAKRIVRLDGEGFRAALRGCRLAAHPGKGYEVLAAHGAARPRTRAR